MAEKKGAGGKPQEYNTVSGRYGSDSGEGEKLYQAVKDYKANKLESNFALREGKAMANNLIVL